MPAGGRQARRLSQIAAELLAGHVEHPELELRIRLDPVGQPGEASPGGFEGLEARVVKEVAHPGPDHLVHRADEPRHPRVVGRHGVARGDPPKEPVEVLGAARRLFARTGEKVGHDVVGCAARRRLGRPRGGLCRLGSGPRSQGLEGIGEGRGVEELLPRAPKGAEGGRALEESIGMEIVEGLEPQGRRGPARPRQFERHGDVELGEELVDVVPVDAEGEPIEPERSRRGGAPGEVAHDEHAQGRLGVGGRPAGLLHRGRQLDFGAFERARSRHRAFGHSLTGVIEGPA